MTAQQQKWIAQLSRCTFLPGSFDKRFVRDMADLGIYDVLTEKQALCLHRLAYHYRKQRGDPGMAKPEHIKRAGVSPVDVLQLQQWNEGKPL